MIKILFSLCILRFSLLAECTNSCKETADAINTAAKAVVNLYVVQVDEQVFNHFLGNPAFQSFFGPNFAKNHSQARLGSGSGVIVSEDGLVVTCAHVVQQAKQIKVKLNDDREFEAEILPTPPGFESEDIAILKIKKDKSDILPIAKIGDSDNLVVTEPIYAVGNAFGIGQSITGGIISALNRVVDDLVAIQIDAAVNPGNSGGAVFNKIGEYIGIPSAIVSRTGANHGVGFIRPVSLVKVMLQRLNSNKDEEPWLGLSYQDFTHELAKAIDHFSLKDYTGGVLVTQINQESPFFQSIKEKDVILKINDIPVENSSVLDFRVKLLSLNDKVTLTLWRDGIITVSAKLRKIPESENEKFHLLKGNHLLNGYTVAKATERLLQTLKLPKTLKGKVIITSSPRRKGNILNFSLAPGDVLTELNGNQIQNVEDIVNSKEIRSITAQRGQQQINLFQS